MKRRDRLELLAVVAVSVAAVGVVLTASWTLAAMVLTLAVR